MPSSDMARWVKRYTSPPLPPPPFRLMALLSHLTFNSGFGGGSSKSEARCTYVDSIWRAV